MKVSSVSPDRWLTITPHPLSCAILHLREEVLWTLQVTTRYKWWHPSKTADLRSHRLSDSANLIDFKQQTVAGLLLHGLGDAFGVGHGQIIPNNLDVCAACEVGPGRPVILVKGILDGQHCERKDRILKYRCFSLGKFNRCDLRIPRKLLCNYIQEWL